MIKRFRFWLLKRLIKNDEKYLLAMATDIRVFDLERSIVLVPACDADKTKEDISQLKELRKLLSTKDYV